MWFQLKSQQGLCETGQVDPKVYNDEGSVKDR